MVRLGFEAATYDNKSSLIDRHSATQHNTETI